MSQPFELVPRSATFGSAMPDYSDGSLRPKMRWEHTLALHYTGVRVPESWLSDPHRALRDIQRYAASSGRYGTGWEYGYMIHPRHDDKIYEYAGDYLAYHASGFNYEAMSILFLLGPGDDLTQNMIDKARWLRWVMEAFGTLRPDNRICGHRELPKSTSCPGEEVMKDKPLWLQPWVPDSGTPDPQPPPPPAPPAGTLTETGRYYVESGDSVWKMAGVGYGRGTNAGMQRILDANKPDTVPNPGEVWDVPGVKGSWLDVKHGDGPWSLIRRADETPNGATVEDFYAWNGHDRVLQPGDRVFVRMT